MSQIKLFDIIANNTLFLKKKIAEKKTRSPPRVQGPDRTLKTYRGKKKRGRQIRCARAVFSENFRHVESTRFEFGLSNFARNLSVFYWNVHNMKVAVSFSWKKTVTFMLWTFQWETLGSHAKLPSQNSLHGEILIADIKKTLGFPRNDGKIQTLSSKFENYYSRHKENIRVSSKRWIFQNCFQILKFLFQTLRKH